MRLQELSDDELREIAMQRGKRGRYTVDAIRAQEILWNRNHWGGKPSRYASITGDNWDGVLDDNMKIYEDYTKGAER